MPGPAKGTVYRDREPIAKAVLNFIRKEGYKFEKGVCKADIRKKLKITQRMVEIVLEMLQERGIIERNYHGRWELTE